VLVFWSDWHLGAAGTDYKAFQNDLDTLTLARELLGQQMLLIANGDLIDGYLSTGTPTNPVQVLSPREQRMAATQVINRVRPNLVIEGDHDEWHRKQELEYDWLGDHCYDNDIPFAQWGTKITATTHAGEYRMLVRHRFKGSRATDSLRPHKNLHLDLGPADLVALAHTHSQPGVFRVHARRRHEGEFLAVQSGTYKILDDYGKKLGYTGADYGVPAVILHPDGRVDKFDSFQDALQVLL